MDTTAPTIDQWYRLYDTAAKIKELRPWEWMLESDVFGFRDSTSDRVDFISVMGAQDEHLSVAVYLGDRAIHDLFRIVNSETLPTPGDLFEMRHLQASFEDRDLLAKEDRATIKRLGLKFRGRQAWPMFRSYRPGFFPWFVEAREAEILIRALDQILDVAPRLKDDPFLLGAPHEDGNFLVRSRQSGRDGAWSERFAHVPEPEPLYADERVGKELTDKLRILPKGPVRVDLLNPESGMEQMWSSVPKKVVELLIDSKVHPAEIVFNSDRMKQLLASVCEQADVALRTADSLHALEEARDSLEEYLIDPPEDPDDELYGQEYEVGTSTAFPDWQPRVTTAPRSLLEAILQPDATPYERLRRRETDLTLEIVKDVPRPVILRAAREMGMLGQGNVSLLESDEEMGNLMDRCLYDISWDGATLLERFIASRAAHLGVEDRATLASMADSYYSLFEITGVEPRSDAVHLSDLLGDRSCALIDINLSDTVLPGLLLATRVISIEGLCMTTGASCAFEPDHRTTLISGLTPKGPAQTKKKRQGKKPRPRQRSDYSAYFFRKHRQLSHIHVRTLTMG